MTVDLDTRLLRAFVAVAEELHFTRAAERLFVAQQALSAQIRQLERRVGVTVFERSTRKVALTDAGERLLPHARTVLEALDTATAELEAARRAERVTLRVGSVPAARRTLPDPGTVPFDVARVMVEQQRRGTQVVGPPMPA